MGYGTSVPDGDWFCPDCRPEHWAVQTGHQPGHAPPPGARRSPATPQRRRQQAAARAGPLRRPAPQPSLHRASRGAAMQVNSPGHLTRTNSTHPALPAQPALAATARERARARAPARVPARLPARPVLTTLDLASDVSAEEEQASAAMQRARLERDASREQRYVASGPAHCAIASNRHNWDSIRAGTAEFADMARVAQHVHSQAADGSDAVQALHGAAQSAGTPGRRFRRPRERATLASDHSWRSSAMPLPHALNVHDALWQHPSNSVHHTLGASPSPSRTMHIAGSLATTSAAPAEYGIGSIATWPGAASESTHRRRPRSEAEHVSALVCNGSFSGFAATLHLTRITCLLSI